MKLVVLVLCLVVVGAVPDHPLRQLSDATTLYVRRVDEARDRLGRQYSSAALHFAYQIAAQAEFHLTTSTCPVSDPFVEAIVIDQAGKFRQSLQVYETAKKEYHESLATYNASISEIVETIKHGRCKGNVWCDIKEWTVILCIIGVFTMCAVWIVDKLHRAYPAQLKMFDQFFDVLSALAILRALARCFGLM